MFVSRLLPSSIRFALLALLLALPLTLTAAPASAAVSSLGSVHIAAPALTQPAVPMSLSDCRAVARTVYGTPWQKVYAATRSWGCGAWLGDMNASSICWQSQQWWGGHARWLVWAITWGQYTRC